MSMRVLSTLTVLLLPLLSLQNPICPLCSLGYPQTQQDYSSSYQSRNSQIGYGSANLQFGSYPSSTKSSSSFYGGDANTFGSELGRAIAQRINQIYGSNPSGSSSSSINTQSSRTYGAYPDSIPNRLPSYPDTSNYFPASTGSQSSYSSGSMNTVNSVDRTNTGYFNNNNNNNNFVSQPVVQSQSKGSCPYCFGNQNNNGYGPYYKKAKAAKQAKKN